MSCTSVIKVILRPISFLCVQRNTHGKSRRSMTC
nr:MAG TPA: hypothetical protein [Caudoviricetes sp.]